MLLGLGALPRGDGLRPILELVTEPLSSFISTFGFESAAGRVDACRAMALSLEIACVGVVSFVRRRSEVVGLLTVPKELRRDNDPEDKGDIGLKE